MNEQGEPMEESSQSASAAKSAQDYATAIEVVGEIAVIVIEFIPGGTAAKKIVQTAPKIAGVAKKAAPIIDQHSEALGDAMNKLTDSAPGAFKAIAGFAQRRADDLADAGGKAFAAISDPIKDNLDEARNKKAQKEARQQIIDNAFGSLTLSRFLENMAEHEKVSGTSEGNYMNNPGCYIFLTLGKAPMQNLGSYRDVYVGASMNMGRSVADEIAGKGSIDVYADAKYDQGVHILFYPCNESELDRMRESLIIALDADESYNKGQ